MEKDLFDLSGKVVILTGGLGLLGLNFTEALLGKGAIVHILDLVSKEKAVDILKLSEQIASFGLRYHEGDITDKQDLIRIRNECMERSGRVDVLINAAALNPKVEKGSQTQSTSKTFEETELNDWNRELGVNLTGAMLCCQVFGNIMERGSSVINIASVYAVIGPDQSIYADGFIKPASYSVSKGGVISLTKYLAAYWGKKGIRVNCLVFGGVENRQDEQFIERYSRKTPLGRMAKPNEFNGLVLYLASNASSYMTGSTLVIDGGLTSW